MIIIIVKDETKFQGIKLFELEVLIYKANKFNSKQVDVIQSL